MGDCFSQYPFLDHSYDADEHYQKICQQLCAHTMWIRSVLIFAPKHKINDVIYDKLILTCGDDELIKLWDIGTGTNVLKSKLGFGMNCIEELCYVENGVTYQYFGIGGEFGHIIIYDYATNTIVKRLVGESRNILTINKLPHLKNPENLSNIIVTSNSKGGIRFWNWQRGVCLKVLSFGIQPIQGLQIWTRQGNYKERGSQIMMMNSYENKVFLWNINGHSIRKIKQYTKHTNWVRSVVCHTLQRRREKNGKRSSLHLLISAGDDNAIRIYNIISGECLQLLKGHSSGIIYMELLNNLLLSGENCGRIGVTNLEDMSTYQIATGLCFDYYKGFSLGLNQSNGEITLGVVGSSPKKSSYHFLNIYRGKLIGNKIAFDIPKAIST